MKIIDLSKAAPAVAIFGYGKSGAGKTRWAASWPRPLFLSVGIERGWETIRNMDPKLMFEPARRPEVWAMEEPGDFPKAITELDGILKKDPMKYRTIVVDSDTHLLDAYLTDCERTIQAKDGRNVYRELWKRYGFECARLHTTALKYDASVIHLALESPASQENPTCKPLLIGQAGDKLPSMCEYMLYFRTWREDPKSPQQWEIRVRPFDRSAARGRDEGKLPDPLPQGGYAAIAPILGLPVKL